MPKKPETIQTVNRLLQALLGAEPMVEFTEPMNDIMVEQNYALAQMFANKGFRDYMENAVNRAIKSAVVNSDDMVALVYNKSRVILLKELLVVAKRAYETLEKMKKLNLKHAANS